MHYFFCKLIPPRPTFAQDMTEQEAQVMQEHAAYWTALAEQGRAVVFGPVADPEGVWGLVVVAAEDEAEVQAITANDPVRRAGIGAAYRILPMLRAVIGARAEWGGAPGEGENSGKG